MSYTSVPGSDASHQTMTAETYGSDKPGDLIGVVASQVPVRLLEVSRSGCLLESQTRIEERAIGTISMKVDGELCSDDIQIEHCRRVEGAGSLYRVGAKFIWTRRPTYRSLRAAIHRLLNGQAKAVKPMAARAPSM